MRLECAEAGKRLDVFLAESVAGLSRSAAQNLLEQGAVTRNGRPAKKNEKTAPGDVIEITLPEPEPLDIPATAHGAVHCLRG